MVRQRSAKPLFASSNLAGTSKKTHTFRCAFSFFAETGTDRFEPSNADVRWTSAQILLDGFDTLMILFTEKNHVTNLAGTPDFRALLPYLIAIVIDVVSFSC